MKRKQSDEKVQFWRRLLEEQPRSGMTVKAFCQQNRVSVPSFYSWRRKIEQHDSSVSRNQDCDHGALVPVKVVAAVEQQPSDDFCRVDYIEIITPAGFTLRVHRDLSTESIGRLLAAIEPGYRGAASC
jgi:hypothetical protein